MKKYLLFLFVLQFFFLMAIGQSKYWVGVAGASWSGAANWSAVSGGAGGAGAPGTLEDAIIDANATIIIDVNVAVTSISITTNAVVLFQSAVSRNITPTSTSAAKPALRIDAGCSLTLDCTNTGVSPNNFWLNLSNGLGVRGQIDGTLIFSGTGGSTGSNGRFITYTSALNTGNVTVSSTGRIKFLDFTGNAVTTPATFTMQDGAVYELARNGGVFPDATWQSNSLALANGTGDDGPLFEGLNYGNLEINCPLLQLTIYFNKNIGFNNINLVHTGVNAVRAKTGTDPTTYTTTINGNLTVSSNAVLETTGSSTTSGNPGIIIVKGNIINNGIIRENGNAVGNRFILQGTANQDISGSGSYAGDDLDFAINNNSGATLLVPLVLPYRYTINAGNLTLNNNNLTTPAINQVGAPSATNNHIVTNGTGKVIVNNIGAAIVIFPIGASATTINPIAISNGSGLNYAVRVETGINPPIYAPINAVNRTWFVTPMGGNPTGVNTNFFYNGTDGNAGFNYTAPVQLGQYTGVWNVIQSNITPVGSYQVPTTVNTYGNNIEAPLVIGNLGAILAAGNSVQVIDFTGAKQNSQHVLNWKVNCLSTPHVIIELERSADGRNYNSIYSIFATALRCRQPFDYTDASPAKGVNYYRLKMTDVDGKIFYSSIVPIINAGKGIEIMNIAPNPIVNAAFNLKLSTAEKMQVELVITDMQGRVMMKQFANTIAGFNTITVNVRQLAPGSYQLFGNTAAGRTRVLRFVVQ